MYTEGILKQINTHYFTLFHVRFCCSRIQFAMNCTVAMFCCLCAKSHKTRCQRKGSPTTVEHGDIIHTIGLATTCNISCSTYSNIPFCTKTMQDYVMNWRYYTTKLQFLLFPFGNEHNILFSLDDLPAPNEN